MAQRILYPLLKAFDADGKPLVGGQVRTLQADSDTRAAVYAARAKNKHGYAKNPIVLNADGEAKIFWHDHFENYVDYSVTVSGGLTPSGESS